MKNRNALLVIFFTVFLDLLGFGIVIPIVPSLAVELGDQPVDPKQRLRHCLGLSRSSRPSPSSPRRNPITESGTS